LKAYLYAHVADKEATRAFTKVNWGAKKAWQESGQGTERHESTSVFDEKGSWEIEIAPVNLPSGFSGHELGIHGIVAESPATSVCVGAYAAQRLEKIEHSDVLSARAIDDRERIDRDWRIDRDVLFLGGWRRGQKCHAGQQDGQDCSSEFPVLSSQHPVSL
jgi:hypothetical protein